jgi:hypothetical protein
MTPPLIVITDRRLPPDELARLVRAYFGDMVKFVVDVRRRRVAVGGELHADAEALLLEDGSHQPDLWGGNYYPGLGPGGCLEYTALINIRPTQDNPGMEIAHRAVREQVGAIARELIGDGGPL